MPCKFNNFHPSAVLLAPLVANNSDYLTSAGFCLKSPLSKKQSLLSTPLSLSEEKKKGIVVSASAGAESPSKKPLLLSTATSFSEEKRRSYLSFSSSWS